MAAQPVAPSADRAAMANSATMIRPPSRAGTTTGAPNAAEPSLESLTIEKLSATDARNLLQKHLGKEKYDQYWALLRKFLQSKLSKPEFDSNMRRLLVSKELINLHNMFLLSILKSAFASAGTKKTPKTTTRTVFPKPAPYRRRHPSDPSVQARETMEYNALLGRMNKAAKNHGLLPVDGSCAQLMLLALERYLARVVCAVTPNVRTQADIGDLLLPHQEQILTTLPGDISGPDLQRAALRRPTLLSDNQALLMQKFDMEIE